ncbi:hypothetical protein [Nonomuraea sp. NPDC049129]|uniref:hypothetical protein n=1 Tax=Nonomuraea sp. NPDC049129 TaxID=3155272 RepID=UPI0033E4EF25
MSSPDGVLAAIDAAVRDYSVSPDAMRWAPEEPVPTLPLAVNLSVNLSAFTAAMASIGKAFCPLLSDTKGMSIDRGEYNRRRRRRNRR